MSSPTGPAGLADEQQRRRMQRLNRRHQHRRHHHQSKQQQQQIPSSCAQPAPRANVRHAADMSVSQPAPASRVCMLAAHLTAAAAAAPPSPPRPLPTHYKYVIVGAGMAGLLQAVRLVDSGLVTDPSAEILMVERGGDVGGTWYWNRFPGCACDVESAAYLPFLHRTEYAPEEKYSSGREIQHYLRRLALRLGVFKLVRFHTEAVAARYRHHQHSSPSPAEAQAPQPQWAVDLAPARTAAAADPAATAAAGRAAAATKTPTTTTVTCNYLVLAVGPLSTPRLPAVRNLGAFRGRLLHSADWEGAASLLGDLRGQTVGVVGTGATAVQVVPEVAAVAGKLLVFQRTPCWCGPRHNRDLTKAEAESVKRDAGVEAGRKQGFDEQTDAFNGNINDADSNKKIQAALARRIKSIVRDPDTAAALTPTYPVGCKRLCVTDDYWPTFNRPNVQLVADARGVEELTATGVVMGGAEHKVDTLILATGYDAFTGAFEGLDIRGRDGRGLREHWRDGPRSAGGVHVHGFPNLFLLVGPLSPGVIANITAVVLRQTEHVVEVVRRAQHEANARRGSAFDLPTEADLFTAIEVGAEPEQEWVRHCDMLYRGSVWSQCSSWYNKQSQGLEPARREQVDGYVGRYDHYRATLTELRSPAKGAFRFTRPQL